jgi:hypothetical protein
MQECRHLTDHRQFNFVKRVCIAKKLKLQTKVDCLIPVTIVRVLRATLNRTLQFALQVVFKHGKDTSWNPGAYLFLFFRETDSDLDENH